MLKTLSILVISAISAFALNPYELAINQVNAAGTGYLSTPVTSTSTYLVGFGAGRVLSPFSPAQVISNAGLTTLSGYGITDAYTKVQSDSNYAFASGPFPWTGVTGAPSFLTTNQNISISGDASGSGSTSISLTVSKLSALTTNGFVKTSSGNGTLVIDTTSYLSQSDAAATYQTQSAMSAYQTTAAMSAYATTSSLSSYQTTSGMAAYLTMASASSTYQTQAGMSSYLSIASASSTYLTQANAASTYATTASLSGYATTSSLSAYLTSATASTTYATISGLSSYLTTASAASTYQPIGSYLTASSLTPYLLSATASTSYQPIGSYLTGNQSISLSGYASGSGTTSISVTVNKVKGVTDGSNATAGDVGEYVTTSKASGSATSLTNNVATNVMSISLTAGDWDIDSNVNLLGGVVTLTGSTCGVSTTSATIPTDGTECYSAFSSVLLTATNSVNLPRKRVSVSSTTTVYLVAKCAFSVGTESAFGSLSARRVR